MKKPLSEILSELEMYLEAVEVGIEAANPTDYFTGLKGELSEKVDGWIDYLEGLDVLLSHTEQKRDYYSKRAKALQTLRERKKEYLAMLLKMANLPEIRGTDHRIALRRNSIPSLHFNVKITGFKHNYVMETYRCELPDQYPEFFSLTSFYAMDADAVKKSLIAGRKLNFAELEYGNHVRIV